MGTLMQPLQCDLRLDKSQQGCAAIPLRSADTELQNAIELRSTAPQIAAILQLPKPDLDAKAEKRRFWSAF